MRIGLRPAVDQEQRPPALALPQVGDLGGLERQPAGGELARVGRGHTGTVPERRIPSSSNGGPALRPEDHRGQVAARVGGRAHLGGVERPGRAAQVLRARDAALPVGRAAHRPPEDLFRGRRRGSLPAPQRPPRAAPDGLRRLRPARREPRDQDRQAPARVDRGVDQRSSGSSSASGASRSTGRASSARTSPSTTAGPSGSSCACSSAGWPTARRPRSSGAPTTRPFWPTSR